MSVPNGDGLTREYMIRQVARRLSPELQAEYYNMLRHCRNLPANDELLIILNAIQILSLLTIDLPGQVAGEREKIERLFMSRAKAEENSVRILLEYQAKLNERVGSVPEEIARLLNPEVIATLITESLRQQFEKTTMPEAVKDVRTGADEIKSSAQEIRAWAKAVGKVIEDTLVGANGIVARVESKGVETMERVSNAAERMARILRAEIAGLILVGWGVGVVMGLMLAMLFHDWWNAPAQPVLPALVLPQTPATAPPAETRPKPQTHRK